MPGIARETMDRVKRRAPRAVTGALLVLAACTPPPPPAPPPLPPPPPPAGPPPFTATEVWSAEPGLVLRGDSGPVTLPWAFMRMAVVRVDSTGLVVRCMACRGFPQGRVERSRVVHEVRPPLEARQLGLADFALAVREAARRKDVDALRRVMARDFVSTLDGPEGPGEAIAGWQGPRAGDLDRLAELLDRGIVSTGGGGVWAAPPEFVNQRGYADLRAGFRRGRDGWEFSFLMRSGLPSGPLRGPSTAAAVKRLRAAVGCVQRGAGGGAACSFPETFRLWFLAPATTRPDASAPTTHRRGSHEEAAPGDRRTAGRVVRDGGRGSRAGNRGRAHLAALYRGVHHLQRRAVLRVRGDLRRVAQLLGGRLRRNLELLTTAQAARWRRASGRGRPGNDCRTGLSPSTVSRPGSYRWTPSPVITASA